MLIVLPSGGVVLAHLLTHHVSPSLRCQSGDRYASTSRKGRRSHEHRMQRCLPRHLPSPARSCSGIDLEAPDTANTGCRPCPAPRSLDPSRPVVGQPAGGDQDSGHVPDPQPRSDSQTFPGNTGRGCRRNGARLERGWQRPP